MYSYLDKFKNLLILLVLVSGHFLSAPCGYAATDIMEIEINLKDHKFEPSIIEVPSNTKLRVTVNNLDSSIEEFDSPDLKREKIIPGGSKTRIIIAPLKAGEYHFTGEFHEDTAKGKFVVVDKEDFEKNKSLTPSVDEESNKKELDV